MFPGLLDGSADDQQVEDFAFARRQALQTLTDLGSALRLATGFQVGYGVKWGEKDFSDSQP